MSVNSRIFQNGNSQAVRIPKEFAFPPHVHEVLVHREGDRLIIEPAPIRAFTQDFLGALGQWPDFERPPQTRQERDMPLP